MCGGSGGPHRLPETTQTAQFLERPPVDHPHNARRLRSVPAARSPAAHPCTGRPVFDRIPAIGRGAQLAGRANRATAPTRAPRLRHDPPPAPHPDAESKTRPMTGMRRTSLAPAKASSQHARDGLSRPPTPRTFCRPIDVQTRRAARSAAPLALHGRSPERRCGGDRARQGRSRALQGHHRDVPSSPADGKARSDADRTRRSRRKRDESGAASGCHARTAASIVARQQQEHDTADTPAAGTLVRSRNSTDQPSKPGACC